MTSVASAFSLSHLIDHQPASGPGGAFRIHRDAYRDPAVFDLEMRHLFEGGWVFAGHASQLPNPHDYLTVTIGRQPLVLMRDAGGRLGAFINSCRHKGAQVCLHARGNSKAHICPYHSWTYGSDGRNIAIKARAAGGYAASFDADSHDLLRVPRFEEYRGFLFVSLAAIGPTLC